jgi:4-amino-4-deoxy-L-arabinose transferase-like glycosyltransferase
VTDRPARLGRGTLAFLGAGVLLYVGLAVASLRVHSATFDEGTHLPSGYTYLAFGDHRLNPEQPPLVKLLAAAPLLPQRPAFKADDLAWSEARQWELGRRFLYRWNDARGLLLRGRLPVVMLGAALGLAVFFWARRLVGAPAAALAFFLCVLSPDVLAHGQLVTTDVGFGLFTLLAVALFERATARLSPARVLLAGLATGAAFATKFSAPVLLPILAVLAVVAVLCSDAVQDHRGIPVEGRKARTMHVLVALLVVLAVALLVLWASYGFAARMSPDPAVESKVLSALGPPVSGGGKVAAALGRTGLLPEAYVRGLVFVLDNAQGRPTFLMGRLSPSGFPHYFLATFLLKTPIPLLVLLALALATAPRLSPRTAAFLWVPVVLYGLVAATSRLQIGHRHLLPLYPFLFVAAGRSVSLLAARAPRRAKIGAVALGALCAWYATGTLRLHPHYLAYFNELAGGPSQGWRYLVDSNLDWGQDLPGLKAWMDAHGVARLKLSYFGSADPAYYGIDADYLPGYMAPRPARVTREVRPGDVVAVSATNLQGVYLDEADRPLMARFRAEKPLARIGYSIFIYRADFSWSEP